VTDAPSAAPATSSLAWSRTRDDAPELERGVAFLAPLVTRAGRFARIDLGERGALWSRWRWLGLMFWVAVVAGAFAKAWRDEGGLPDPPTTP